MFVVSDESCASVDYTFVTVEVAVCSLGCSDVTVGWGTDFEMTCPDVSYGWCITEHHDGTMPLPIVFYCFDRLLAVLGGCHDVSICASG